MESAERFFPKFDGAIELTDSVIPELYKNSETFLNINNNYIDIPDIYSFENISFGKAVRGEVIIDRPAFIMNRSHMYCHFLFDHVGGFYGIKNVLKQISPYFIIKPKESMQNFKFTFDKNWLEFEGYDFNSHFLYPEFYKYTFKNVYDFSSYNRRQTLSTSFDFPIKFVRENLINKSNNVPNSPKKIFISRTDSLTRRSGMHDLINFESFFVSKGFKIITLQGMDMQKQIDLFYNATDVVSMAGSGLTNSVFCKEGTNIVSINPDQDSYFCNIWSKISKLSNLNYMEISVNHQDKDAEKYLLSLKKNSNYLNELFY
jgi:hypothetical protein